MASPACKGLLEHQAYHSPWRVVALYYTVEFGRRGRRTHTCGSSHGFTEETAQCWAAVKSVQDMSHSARDYGDEDEQGSASKKYRSLKCRTMASHSRPLTKRSGMAATCVTPGSVLHLLAHGWQETSVIDKRRLHCKLVSTGYSQYSSRDNGSWPSQASHW